jgi:hypothetical protein
MQLLMERAVSPNWLTILGAIYLAYAFGFFALSAMYSGGWTGSSDFQRFVTERGQRVAVFFACFTGVLGLLLHAAGQGATAEIGTWFVVGALALIPLLLAYVFWGDRIVESERARLSTSASASAVSGSTDLLRQIRQAAE